MHDLSPFLAAAVLSIEAQRWQHVGNKEARVYDVLGVSMPRYHQMVAALIDTELALQLDAATVYRLRRRRDRRAA